MVNRQRGSTLIEALVAMLIFLFGALGVIGMQATAISVTAESKYRSDAGQLASELLGRIWARAAQRSVETPAVAPATVIAAYAWDGNGTPPSDVTEWWSNVQRRLGPAVLPPVIAAPSPNTNNQVSVTIRWQPPGATDSREYSVIAYVNTSAE